MIDYTWVAWFEELAAKIAEGGEGYLIERARNVAWQEDGREGVPALLRYGDENIDPFSFLYFLAHKNTRNQYNRPVSCITFLPIQTFTAQNTGVSGRNSAWLKFTASEDKPHAQNGRLGPSFPRKRESRDFRD